MENTNELSQRFTKALFAEAPNLEAHLKREREYWLPDSTPLTMEFAALGRGVADEYNGFDSSQTREIFRLVEEAVGSKNEKFVEAILTGFLESMMSRFERSDVEIKFVTAQLGGKSKMHVGAWQSV